MKEPALKLKVDVEAIALPKGRRVGTSGHAKVEEYLTTRLREIGCKPYRGRSFRLPYSVGGQQFTNLAGKIPGRNPKLPPLLIGAHYDSVIDAPCADDNAAAVAIALAVGKQVASLERDLIVAIFDAEEPPYFQTPAMGSNRFYKDQMDARGVHAAIIMDLVGHDVSMPLGDIAGLIPGVGSIVNRFQKLAECDMKLPLLHNLLFITGAESHPSLAGVLDSCEHPDALKIVPTLNRYVGDMSDHGAFRKKGVPYLFLSCGRWAHYHQKTDTPDRLNYTKMAAISDLTESLLVALDEEELPHGSKERVCDTLELEATYLRRSLGPLHPVLLKLAGVKEVLSREDMDACVEKLLSAGV